MAGDRATFGPLADGATCSCLVLPPRSASGILLESPKPNLGPAPDYDASSTPSTPVCPKAGDFINQGTWRLFC